MLPTSLRQPARRRTVGQHLTALLGKTGARVFLCLLAMTCVAPLWMFWSAGSTQDYDNYWQSRPLPLPSVMQTELFRFEAGSQDRAVIAMC